MTVEEISNERALEICRMMGKYGLVATTLFTREDVAYVLNNTLKKFDDDSFEILEKINELKEKLNETSVDTEKEKIFSQIDEFKKEFEQDKIHRELIECAIELAYTMFDEKHYKKIKNIILSKVENEKIIHDNFCQIFLAYEEKLYYPCICGAIPMIERIIQNNDNLSDTKLTRLFGEIANNTEIDGDFEKELLVVNLEEFIKQISAYKEFSEDEPTGINRHWVLHGRTIYESRRVDCLKVFIAIYSLMELLGDELQA